MSGNAMYLQVAITIMIPGLLKCQIHCSLFQFLKLRSNKKFRKWMLFSSHVARARLVPTAVRDLMIKCQRSYPLGHGNPKRYYLTDRNNMTYAFQDSRCQFGIKKNKNIKFLPFIKEAKQKYIFSFPRPKIDCRWSIKIKRERRSFFL